MFTNHAYQTIVISNDNTSIISDNLGMFLATQDMFTQDDAARILRECAEKGTDVKF